jgi:uncharacterized protein (DUF1800 family)
MRRDGYPPDDNDDPYRDSYYEPEYEQGYGPLGYDRTGAEPVHRAGSGPHFHDSDLSGRGYPPLPDLDDHDDHDGGSRSKWRRRTTLAALGGGAAALIGGAVMRFVGAPTNADAAAHNATYTENESYMNGQAGAGVRKNTPVSGRVFSTPSQAAANAVPKGNTVLPKDDAVRHLASRLTFGPTPKVMNDIRTLGIDGWIAQQLKPETIPETHAEQMLKKDLTTYSMTWEYLDQHNRELQSRGIHADEENIQYVIGRMLWSDRQLFETLVDFLDNFIHVAANDSKADNKYRASFDQNVIRKFALGKYPDLFVAANNHPALMLYLDQDKSTFSMKDMKDAVNENLAREDLELYTVGANNGYTETDVRQAALLMTGRGIRRHAGAVNDGQFEYHPNDHYVGPVKVMGFSHPNSTAEGGEAVQDAYFRYIALHPNTARHFAQKMATRFVSDTPPESIVARMAQAYLDTGGAIVPVFMTMLRSTEFWESAGMKVRRPMEYVVATYRALGVQADTPAGFTSSDPNATPFMLGLRELHHELQELDHFPMGKLTPNGYADIFLAWSSASTMIKCWNEAYDAIEGRRRMFTYVKPEQLVGTTPPATAGAYLDALSKRLINVIFNDSQKAAILSIAGAQANTPVDARFNGAITDIARAIFATPHHHLR